jgi:general secretion pathway protein F
MLVIGSVLISIMMIVVVPKVTSIFASLDRALPWYTSMLIAVSSALGSAQMLGFVMALFTMTATRRALATGASVADKKAVWTAFAFGSAGLLILFGFVVESVVAYSIGLGLGLLGGFLLSRFLNFVATPAGQIWKDTLLLKLPIFGTLLRMLAVSRFARTLSTLLNSGVPLLKAMEIVKNVLDNARLSKIIEDAAGSIREGESIAGPLKRSGDFPPIVTHMIAVGEKSGQLEQMLENVAKAYDTQVETRVQALTSLLEPLMIVIMGGAVGFIAFAILMPLIQMNDFVQ